MNTKSYVSMEQHVCPVCGKRHDSGAILLDRKLRNKFDSHALTGWGLCDEHQKQFDDGYVFLIGANNPSGTNLQLDEADRTSDVISVKRDVMETVCNTNVPDHGLMFCDPEVIVMFKEKLNEQTNSKED